jgi:hypothetical protein
VYDDSVLQQMLSAAEARLASLQVIDQTSILSHLGSITGATQQTSSFGLSLQGPPGAQAVTAANGATKQIVDTVKTGGDTTVGTTTAAPVQNVTTTVPQFNVPTATAPAPSTSLPTSFSVSASDILNEQMQLTSEVINLRLLIEGSLSDRILHTQVTDSDGKTHEISFIRPRTTVGFPITISADKRFKDAVAVVEVEVETSEKNNFSSNGESPIITALLPREKTYNVAAITDKNVSIGAGMVTQVAGVSGSFLFGRKTYYIVQDQDTIALTLNDDPSNIRRTGFMWQFRPVLGAPYVKPGLKQTFVQLAFPAPKSSGSFGNIRVKTYWRKFDQKTGILKEVVKNSLVDTQVPAPIPTFDMRQLVRLNATNLEDLGNGQMLVTLHGDFLGGTYVRVGSTILQAGSTGFTSEYTQIRFIAPIADLATKKTVLVARDGTETPLTISDPVIDLAGNPIRIKGIPPPSVTAIDESNSLLQIEFDPPVKTLPSMPLVLVIGGKVFGYSDAPISRQQGPIGSDYTVATNGLSAALPTAFLLSNPDVVVRPLMVDDRYFDKATLFEPSDEGVRFLLLAQTTKPQQKKKKEDTGQAGKAQKNDTQSAGTVKYLLYGRSLDDVSVVVPKADLQELGDGVDSESLRLLELDLAVAKTQKLVVLQHAGGRPFVVALPALPADPANPTKPDQPATGLKFQERVTVGADEAVIVGDGLTADTTVSFQKQPLTAKLSADGKSLKIAGLAAAGATAAAKTQDIDVKTGTSKPVTIKLEVVNTKVETVQK